MKLLKKSLEDGKSVVFDMGHLLKSERDTARAIASETEATYKLIFLNNPKLEIEKRWKENEITKSRGQLSRKTLDKAYSLWEKPLPSENPIIYNDSIDIDVWVKEHIDTAIA